MPDDLWAQVLGPCTPAIAALCDAFESSTDPAAHFASRAPAITLADQNKAFERLGHGWLAKVPRRGQLPEWAL
eukprot:9949333-Lingulodinium_polyedra.AAC.1